MNLNPYIQTNAAGSFNVTSDGLVQGFMMADPAARNALSGGVLGPNETLPMWGGVAITEDIPPATSGGKSMDLTLGGNIVRSTAVANITGFSVFDQNYAAINMPQSPVPLTNNGGLVNFFRLGSGIRLAVACAAGLVSIDGSAINTQVSWDFAAQQLVPYTPAYNAVATTGAAWANTSGGRITFTVGTDLTAVLAAGSVIDVSGVVATGATTGNYNGTWVVAAVTATTVVVTAPAASNIFGTYASGGTIAAGGGALNVKVLKVAPTNSMTVAYSAVTGFANWNRNGSAAVILL